MRPLVVASCDTDLSLLRFLDVPEGLHAQSGTDLVDAFSSLDFDDTEPAARQPLGPRQENSPQLQNKTANPKTLKRRQQRQKAESTLPYSNRPLRKPRQKYIDKGRNLISEWQSEKPNPGTTGFTGPRRAENASGNLNMEGVNQLIQERGYRLYEANDSPLLCSDSHGRIIAARHWALRGDDLKDFEVAVDELASSGDLKQFGLDMTQEKRGSFQQWSYGVSHGGGSLIPHIEKQPKRRAEAWRVFFQRPSVARYLRNAINAMSTFFPEKAKEYRGYAALLSQHLESLVKGNIWESSPFFRHTLNLGPRTVTLRHRDFFNLAYGLCSILVFGSFDHKKGGHLILHELKLVLEVRPGDMVWIPSAAVTHENSEIGEDEWRRSLVSYSSGELVRWLTLGGRNVNQLDEEAQEQHFNEAIARVESGWSKFSTLDELKIM